MGEQVAAGSQFKGLGRPLNGGVAQLGEHLPCKQGVKGSNPSISIVSVQCTSQRSCPAACRHVLQTGLPVKKNAEHSSKHDLMLLYLENRILRKILKYQSLQNEI